jgi:hypothetical protein
MCLVAPFPHLLAPLLLLASEHFLVVRLGSVVHRPCSHTHPCVHEFSDTDPAFFPLPFHHRSLCRLEDFDGRLVGAKVWVRARMQASRVQGNGCFLVLRQKFSTVQAVLFKGGAISKEMVRYGSAITKESFVRCGVWGVGCGVWGVGCGVWGVGCGVWGVGCGVWGVGCGVWGVGRGRAWWAWVSVGRSTVGRDAWDRDAWGVEGGVLMCVGRGWACGARGGVLGHARYVLRV